MSTATSLKDARSRRTDGTVSFIQYGLISVGLMVVVGAVKPTFNGSTDADKRSALLATSPTVEESSVALGGLPAPAGEPASESLEPSLKRALDYVSRRYRVAPEALVPIFQAVQNVGRERRLDPLLIIAIIAIESRFNPFAESPVGARGLMQVIPGLHMDKIPEGAGDLPLLDPVTNIQVGVHVLEEAIRWRGSLIRGLQHYGGSPKDPETGYANKVLAEKQRLEQAAGRSNGSRR